jgi:Cd2+/Zn2+-exporting ATPase/Cu+-exporting ATPase
MSLRVLEPERFECLPGQGITCSLDGDLIVVGNRTFLETRGMSAAAFPADSSHSSEIFVGRGGRLLGALQIDDALRPDAIESVAAMKRLGLQTVLLTGDASSIAQAVGARLGVGNVDAGLLPHDKVTKVRALMSNGRKVAMVGDGINDAPALAEAHVGVAMGSGTDVARESADVVLLGNNLLKFVETLRIARRCRSIIWQNFTGTLFVDGVGVGLAAFGLLTPLLAAFIHVASELLFILNSTRLLPGRSR